jgi:MFS transporter, FSR family, fosmidomycin resistance protein
MTGLPRQGVIARFSDDRRVLAAGCGTHALQDGLTASIYILLPVLAQALSLGYAQVGFIRGAHSGAMWLLEIPAGLAAERFGEARLLVGGVFGAALGYFLLSNAHGSVGVTFALAIGGCGAAFQHSLNSSLISRTFTGPSARAALGTYNASGDVGKLLFTGIVSLALTFGFGWRNVALGYCVVALAGAVVLALTLPRSAFTTPRAVASSSGSPSGWGIRHSRGFAALASIVLLDIAVQDGFLVFITFLMVSKGASAAIAPTAVVLTLVGGVVGKFFCGRLSARLGTTPALMLVQLLCMLGIAALLVLPVEAGFVLLPFLGVVLQGSSTITYGAVSDFITPERRARGFALIYSMSGGASIAGAVCIGVLSDSVGLAMAFGVMVGVVGLTLPMALVLQRSLKHVQ